MVNQSISDPSVRLTAALRPALNDILGGSAASVLTITYGLSYALLIFGGPLAPNLSYGVAATFVSSAVLGLVIALGSSLRFAIAAPDTSTAAMTGILASSVVERMAVTDPSAPVLGPVLITFALASVATGILLCGFHAVGVRPRIADADGIGTRGGGDQTLNDKDRGYLSNGDFYPFCTIRLEEADEAK